MKGIFNNLLELIYPTQCVLCGQSGQLVCPGCLQSLSLIDSKANSKICLKCGKPCYYMVEQCRDCRDKRFAFSQSRSLGLYQGDLRELVHKFKYGNSRGLADIFAGLLIERIDSDFFAVDLITSVPLSKNKQKQRGFNQAQLLAQSLALKLDRKFADVLYQSKDTQDQSKLQANERRKNVRNAFSVKQDPGQKGSKILLIDDVFTTGSTVNECSKVLKRAGAGSVRVATIARATFLI